MKRRILALCFLLLTLAASWGTAEEARMTLEVSGVVYGIVDEGEGGRLARRDEAGAWELLELYDVAEIAPYREGELLALHFGDVQRVEVVDARTGRATQTLLRSSTEGGTLYAAFGFAYDAKRDAVYFTQSGEVYRAAAGAPAEAVASIPASGVRLYATASLEGDVYTVTADGETYAADVSGKGTEATLHIAEIKCTYGYEYFVHQRLKNAFKTAYPGVRVVVEERNGDPEELVAELMDAGNEADLYVVGARMARTLMEKGYCLPLSASEPLQGAFRRLYPCLQEPLLYEGEVMAWPRYTRLKAWALHPDIWSAYLDDTPVPKTVDGWLTLLETWDADENPDVTPLSNNYETLWSCFVQRYVSQYERPDQPLSFDTPVFREMIHRLLALQAPNADVERITAAASASIGYDVEDTYTFTPYDIAVPILPPLFGEETPPFVEVEMDVYVIPAASGQPELAMAYIESMAKNAGEDPRLAAKLFSDVREGARSDEFDETLAWFEGEIEKERARLAEEENPVVRGDLEAVIDSLQAIIADKLENEWMITERSLARYRELMRCARVPYDSRVHWTGLDGLGAVLSQMLARCAQGEMTVEVLCRELDARFSMAFMENI